MLHRTCLRLTFTVLTAGGVLSAGLAYGQLFTAPANEHPNPYVTINDHLQDAPGAHLGIDQRGRHRPRWHVDLGR